MSLPATNSASEPAEPLGALKKAESGESDTAPVRTSGSGLVRTGDTKPRSQPSAEDTGRKLKALRATVELSKDALVGEGGADGTSTPLPALELLLVAVGEADAVGEALGDTPIDGVAEDVADGVSLIVSVGDTLAALLAAGDGDDGGVGVVLSDASIDGVAEGVDEADNVSLTLNVDEPLAAPLAAGEIDADTVGVELSDAPPIDGVADNDDAADGVPLTLSVGDELGVIDGVDDGLGVSVALDPSVAVVEVVAVLLGVPLGVAVAV